MPDTVRPALPRDLADAASRLRVARRGLSDVELELAYHAAVPVVVDPGFLHLLRVNFFLDPPSALPYEAEAALLLSPLFREIDDGLFEIEPDLRNLLLLGLGVRYGATRLHRIAILLEDYTAATPAWQAQPELEQAQALTALSILEGRRAALARLDPPSTEDTVLAREWYVAMRSSLTHRLVPDGDETGDLMADLMSTLDGEQPRAAVRLLSSLATLPGVDSAAIAQALARFVTNHPGEDVGHAAAQALLQLRPVPEAELVDEPDTVDFEIHALAFSPGLDTVSVVGLSATLDDASAALASFGGVRVSGGPFQAMDRLNEWSRPSRPRSSVLICVGMEQAGEDGYLTGRRATDPRVDAVRMVEVFRQEWAVRQHDPDAWTLVIIAAPGAMDLLPAIAGSDLPPRLLLVTVDSPTGLSRELRRVAAQTTAITFGQLATRIADNGFVAGAAYLRGDGPVLRRVSALSSMDPIEARCVAALPRAGAFPQVVVGGVDGSLQVWDAAVQRPFATVRGGGGRVRSVAGVRAVDGRDSVVFIADDGVLRVWSVGMAVMEADVRDALSVAPLSNEQVMISRRDGSVVIAEVDEGLRPIEVRYVGEPATQLAWVTGAYGGVVAAVHDDRRLRIVVFAVGHDDRRLRILGSSTLLTGPVNAIAAVPLPDGRVALAVVDRDGVIRLLAYEAPATDDDKASPWRQFGGPVTGPVPARAVAGLVVDGQVMLAIVDVDGGLRFALVPDPSPVAAEPQEAPSGSAAEPEEAPSGLPEPDEARPPGVSRTFGPAPVTVGLWGAAGSGKTTYLAALRVAAITGRGPREVWAVSGRDQDSAEWLGAQFFHLVHSRRFPPVGTAPEPLELVIRARPERRQEDAVAIRVTADRSEPTGGLLLMIEPGRLLGLRPVDDLRDIVDQLKRLRADTAAHRRLPDGRLPQHVAVCLTKFDDPAVYTLAAEAGWVSQPSPQDSPQVPNSRAAEFVDWLFARLPEPAPGFRRLLETTFRPERVGYFVISSIGLRRRADGVVDRVNLANSATLAGERRILDEVRPVNVLEPLLWVARGGGDQRVDVSDQRG